MKKVKKQIISSRTKIALLAVFLPFFLTGCISFQGDDQIQANVFGGIYRNEGNIEDWSQVTQVYTTGDKEANFNKSNITAMTFDPLDNATIYVGTQREGLLYSYNYGKAWQATLAGKGIVNDVVVHPQNNCIIYTAVHNNIFKSTDCARNWRSVYFETQPGQYITNLAIRYDNPNIIYAGNSQGSFLRSLDDGRSWDVLYRFQNNIVGLEILNNTDSNVVYLATQSKGVWRSPDGGVTWRDLMELEVDMADQEEEEFLPFSEVIRRKENATLSFDLDKSVPDGIIYANRSGIFRLTDGQIWKQLSLIPDRGQEAVYSLEINPKNTNEIFYGTASAIYRSLDAGVNWELAPPPSPSSLPKFLEFSPNNEYLFLGMYIIPQD